MKVASLVLDTNVIVSAFRSLEGPSSALLALAEDSKIRLLASNTLLFEYEDVLKRPEHVRAAGQTADDFIESVFDLVRPVSIRFAWRPQLNDPDDEFLLETAVNGGADAIVTYNVRHFHDAARRFGIETLRPVELLRRLRP